jgi:hypothetical protein
VQKPQKSQPDHLEIQRLAHEADAITKSDTFKLIHFNAKKQYLQELLAAPIGSLTAQAAHAKLLVLEDFVSGFKSFINEEKVQRSKT